MCGYWGEQRVGCECDDGFVLRGGSVLLLFLGMFCVLMSMRFVLEGMRNVVGVFFECFGGGVFR